VHGQWYADGAQSLAPCVRGKGNALPGLQSSAVLPEQFCRLAAYDVFLSVTRNHEANHAESIAGPRGRPRSDTHVHEVKKLLHTSPAAIVCDVPENRILTEKSLQNAGDMMHEIHVILRIG
jgi:hypothetical protein